MEKSLKSVVVPYGLFLGIALILITVLAYVIDLELFSKWYLTLISFLFVLGIGIAAVKKAKTLNTADHFSFKNAFTSFFLTVILGAFVSVLFQGLLFNVIDTEAAEYVQEMTMETSRSMMESFGAQQSQIDAAMAEAEGNNPLSWKNIFLGFAFTIVLYAILSLIVALIFKEKDPNKI